MELRSRYAAVGMPWASGIGTNVESCTTAQEVMEKAHLDFTVDKCELVAKMPFRLNAGMNNIQDGTGFAYGGNIYRDCPNAYATYRTDSNTPLGIVKQKYEVVQNIDAFNFFDDAIGKDKAVWQYAGAFGFGHKVFVSAKLPVSTTVKGDKIENYLVFSNSHDGSSSINIMFTPIRMFCLNMLNAALKGADSYIRIRHTESAGRRIQEGGRLLKIACEHATTTEALYNSIAAVKCGDREVMRYIASLILSQDEMAKLYFMGNDNVFDRLFARDFNIVQELELSTRKLNKLVTTFDYYQNGVGQRQIAGTWWGAYNAITGYYSNVDNKIGEKRMDSLLYGTANNTMQLALNKAYELAYAA